MKTEIKNTEITANVVASPTEGPPKMVSVTKQLYLVTLLGTVRCWKLPEIPDKSFYVFESIAWWKGKHDLNFVVVTRQF